MARTGRPRKPTQRHKVVGSFRKDRHNDDEPTPPEGVPDCPAWVKAEARNHWNEIVPMLAGMGIMSPAYAPGLAMLVNSLGRYIEYERRVDETGPVTMTDKGNEIVNPYWAARNKAWDQAMKALREFGLTPAAATAVRVGDQGKGEKKNGIAGKINPKLVG